MRPSRSKPASAQQPRRAQRPDAAANAPLIDPMLVATGIQIARTLGLKKVIPLLALVGVALGYMANRSSAAADDDTNETCDPDEVADD